MTFIFPGSFFIIQIMFVYQIVEPDFNAMRFFYSLNAHQLAAIALVIVTFGMIIGSLFDAVSYELFNRLFIVRAIRIALFCKDGCDAILTNERWKEEFQGILLQKFLYDPNIYPCSKKDIKNVSNFISMYVMMYSPEAAKGAISDTWFHYHFSITAFLAFISGGITFSTLYWIKNPLWPQSLIPIVCLLVAFLLSINAWDLSKALWRLFVRSFVLTLYKIDRS